MRIRKLLYSALGIKWNLLLEIEIMVLMVNYATQSGLNKNKMTPGRLPCDSM